MIGEFDDNISNSRRQILQTYQEGSKDTMMNIVYKALMEGEQQAITSKTPVNEKVKALKNVLGYFETTEEYEKCHNIKKIIDKIC